MSKKNIESGNFNQEIKEIKNKKGTIIEKRMSLIPKKSKKKNDINKISLDEVNKIYKAMLVKNVDRKNILIRAMCIDGIKTLKCYDNEGDDLKYCLEDYYNSMPVEVQGKFNEFLHVELIVRY